MKLYVAIYATDENIETLIRNKNRNVSEIKT